MRDTLVTIGLPFYNAEKTLSLAIKSILLQTFSSWRLILVDDGSTDHSLDIAKKFARSDPRIEVLADGVNRGLIYRLNQLIDLAETRYVARMDADDLMLPDRLYRQTEVLEQNPAVDLVDCAVFTMDENMIPVGIRFTEIINYEPKNVLRRAMLLHAAVLGKTSWFKQNRYDECFPRAEDHELWCRTFTFSRFERILEPLYVVREGRVNVSNYRKSLRTVRKIVRQYGAETFTRLEFQLEIVKTHLKIMTYSIAGFFHLQHYLSAKRNRPLDTNTAQHLAEMIQRIKES